MTVAAPAAPSPPVAANPGVRFMPPPSFGSAGPGAVPGAGPLAAGGAAQGAAVDCVVR